MADEAVGTPAATPSGSSPAPASSPSSTPSGAGSSDSGSSSPSFSDNLREASRTYSAEDYNRALAEARTTAVKEYQDKYGWAEQVGDRASFDQTVEFARLASSNPVEAINRLAAAAIAHPEHAPAIRSWMGRMLRQGGQPVAPQPAADPEPGPDVEATDANGQVRQWYSAQRQKEWRDWNDRRLNARIAPLEQRFKQSDEQQELQTQATQLAKRSMGWVSRLPQFTEHREAISRAFDALGQNVTEQTSESEIVANLFTAYIQTVFPKLSAAGQQEAAATTARHAMATTARPMQAAVTTPSKRPLSFAEELRREFAQKTGTS